LLCCLRLIRHIYVSYPTYICFSNNLSFKRHILFNNMLYSTTYFLQQHIYVFNNIYMLFNIIGHVYVMYPWTTYMWSLCNIFMHPPASITPFVALSADQSVVWWACQFIVSSKHSSFNCTTFDSVLPARWCLLPPVYTCLNGVALAQHSEVTLTPRVIHMFEYVCVRGEQDHYSLSRDSQQWPSLTRHHYKVSQ